MGCSGGKPAETSSNGLQRWEANVKFLAIIEAAMREVRANPIQGLPQLQRALDPPASTADAGTRASNGTSGTAGTPWTSQPACMHFLEESTKKAVPKVFHILPDALGSLRLMQDIDAVIAACAVIERCVKLANDPAVGAAMPSIDEQKVKQCVSQLTMLLQEVQIQGEKSYRELSKEDEVRSLEATAIARAIRALFTLEGYATECRREACKTGVKVALDCVKIESGLKLDAQQALVTMLVALLEAPESVKGFITCHGTYALLPYCANPKAYGVTKEFQLLCLKALQNCVKSGQAIENRAAVEAAIEKVENVRKRGVTFSEKRIINL